MGYKLFRAEILAPFCKWEQPGKERRWRCGLNNWRSNLYTCSQVCSTTTKCLSMSACVSATLWLRSGGWAESPHCLHSAPWNVGVDFERIKLCNETEATEKGNLTLSTPKILIKLQWESTYEKVKPKVRQPWGALHYQGIISWTLRFCESKVHTEAKYTAVGLVVTRSFCAVPYLLCALRHALIDASGNPRRQMCSQRVQDQVSNFPTNSCHDQEFLQAIHWQKNNGLFFFLFYILLSQNEL